MYALGIFRIARMHKPSEYRIHARAFVRLNGEGGRNRRQGVLSTKYARLNSAMRNVYNIILLGYVCGLQCVCACVCVSVCCRARKIVQRHCSANQQECSSSSSAPSSHHTSAQNISNVNGVYTPGLSFNDFDAFRVGDLSILGLLDFPRIHKSNCVLNHLLVLSFHLCII